MYGRLPRLGIDGFTRGQVRQPDEPSANHGLVDAVASLGDGRANVGGLFHGAVDGSVAPVGVEELFVEQRLDHFDRQESRTFSQRYFINKM